jgi:DNA-directed RNA polymerase specialized sigma24 family protein
MGRGAPDPADDERRKMIIMDRSELERRKKYMKRYKRNGILIDRLETRLRSLDDRIRSVSSPGLSGMPRGGVPVTKEDLIAEKVDLERRIRGLRSRGRAMEEELRNLIDELDDPRHAEVLESFFIEGRSFSEIAEDMGYTERHVIRLYSEGVMLLHL